MQGRHTGDFNGTSAMGYRIDAAVMDLFRVGDGRLAEHWALMDTLTMLRQIGAVKNRGRAAYPAWHTGHQYSTRPAIGSASTGVSHTRQGRPARCAT